MNISSIYNRHIVTKDESEEKTSDLIQETKVHKEHVTPTKDISKAE